MQTLFDLVLVVLLSLPAAYADRSEEHRLDRLATIAASIVIVSDDATCHDSLPGCVRTWHGPREEIAAYLIAIGWYESRFAQHIHAGRCGPSECDARRIGDTIVHASRSPWQVQRSPLTRAEWNRMRGTDLDATIAAASAAARVLTVSRSRCRTMVGAVSGYMSGSRCSIRQAPARVRMAEQIRGRLEGRPANRPDARVVSREDGAGGIQGEHRGTH